MQCFKKRLSYLVDGLIPAYQKQKYPQYVAFIKGFIEYLDIHVFDKVFRITDNININLVFDELVDEYFQQYFHEVIDTNKYALNDDNKRLFVELSKFFNNQKGKRTSFDLVLNYMENFDVSNAEAKAKYNIDKIEYKIQEDYHNFDTVHKKYDHQYSYNGKDFYKEVTEYFKPFTYRIETDQPKALIWSLIEDINPVGFYPEFDYRQDFSEEWPTISEEFVATIKFDFVDQLYTDRLYDGKYSYGQSSVDTLYLHDGTNLFNSILKYIPKTTTLGPDVITYSPESIIDEFATKIKPQFTDACPHNLLYGGNDDYNSEQTYDGGRELIDVFEVFTQIKSYVEDVLSLSDNFAPVKIGIDYIDTFADIFYNGRFHYRRDFTLTYGVNEYSLKYNGILDYSGTEHYSQIDQYSTDSMHQNYRKYDIYPLYQFINEIILGHEIYLNISGASQIEILNECIALMAAHLGISEDDIAPLVPSLEYDFSIFVNELDTLSQIDSRDDTHYNFNVASIIENITQHFSLPKLESSIEAVWINADVVRYDAEHKYDGGSAALYYAADNIHDAFVANLTMPIEDTCDDVLDSVEVVETNIRASDIVDQVVIYDETTSSIRQTIGLVDDVRGSYSDGITYSPNYTYTTFYNGTYSYSGERSYASEIDFEKYYSDYDKLSIYEFIINSVLGVLPDAWVTPPTTDIEILERCVYGLSVHTGTPESEIAPLGITEETKTDVTYNIVMILAEHYDYSANRILLSIWSAGTDVNSRKYDGYFNYYPIEDYHEEYAITVYRNGIPTSEFDS